MSATQLLNLIVSATDKASSVISGIQRKIAGIGVESGKSSGKAGMLSDAIATGMLKAEAAIGLATFAITKLTDGLKEAASIELENLSAANGLAEGLGSFDKANKFVEQMNVDLSKSAAALPGATASYTAFARAISDDVAEGFKGADGKIKDQEKMFARIKSIATGAGVITAGSPGLAPRQMQLFMQNALSGETSMKQLMKLDAVRKNAHLRSAMEKYMAKVGADRGFKDLDVPSRAKALDDIFSSIVTPEFVDRAKKTADSIWQDFSSGLFDPQSGLFGLMRDFDLNKEGSQTAFDAAKKTLDALIGKSGLFGTIGKLLNSMGFNSDPMEQLAGGFDKLTEWINSLNQIVAGFNGKIPSGTFGKAAAEIINNIARTIVKLPWIDIGLGLIKGIGFLVGEIIGFITNLDGTALIAGAGVLLGAAISTLISGALAALNPSTIATAFLILGKPAIMSTFATLFGMLTSMTGSTAAIAFMSMGSPAVVGFFASIIAPIASIGTAIAGAFATIPGIVWVLAGLAVIQIFKLGWFIIENFSLMPTILAGCFNDIVYAIGNFFSPVPGWIKAAVDGVWWVLKGIIMGIGTAIGWLFEQAKNMIMNHPIVKGAAFVGNAVGKAVGVVPKYMGHIPTAANGLLNAAAIESRNMPAGAGLVMANDSEAILTPNMLQRLVNGSMAIGASSSKSTPANFTQHVTIQGVTDPEANAREVMRYMQIFLDEHMQGVLA